MIIGSKPARAGSGGAEIPKKLLSLLMAAVLALSLAPSAAWAQPEAPAAAPTEKALTDAQTADELATSQTAAAGRGGAATRRACPRSRVG